MYERNITIVVGPGTDIWKQAMSNLPSPFPELAETISIPTSHEEYVDNQKKLLLDKESVKSVKKNNLILNTPFMTIKVHIEKVSGVRKRILQNCRLI